VVREIVRSQGERDFESFGKDGGFASDSAVGVRSSGIRSSAGLSVSKKQAERLAEDLCGALDSGELDVPSVGDASQAWQLVRLVVQALQRGGHTIRSADAEKWAHVLYEPGELRKIFQFVRGRLDDMGLLSQSVIRSSLDEWEGISFQVLLRKFLEGEASAYDVVAIGERSGWTIEDIDEYLFEHGGFPDSIWDYLEDGNSYYVSDYEEDDYEEDFVGSGFIFSAASPGDHIELRYVSTDGKSNKFINMDYAGGPKFTATWGKQGTAGNVTEYPVLEWDAYYRKKTAKGYTDVTGGGVVVPRVRNVPAKAAPAKALVKALVRAPVKAPVAPVAPVVRTPVINAPSTLPTRKRPVKTVSRPPQFVPKFYKNDDQEDKQLSLFDSYRAGWLEEMV
jgi:predicted DNA-binding WGR domain protein